MPRSHAHGGRFSQARRSLTLYHVLTRQTADNGVAFYSSTLLDAIGVTNAFTTRIGGVSTAPFDSLNLGNPPGDVRDAAANVDLNLEKLERSLMLHGRQRVWVRQVHGNRVALAADSSFECGIDADAIVSSDASTYLIVRTADCVPILLSAPGGNAVAAIHAGWRGVIADVTAAAVKALAELSNAPTQDLVAAIGPCIGHESFEVGPEVISEFVRRFGSSPYWADRHIDLAEAVKRQLVDSGICASNIDRTDRCTARDQNEFFSHRRDRGVTGRMAAVIAPVDL